MQGTKDYGIHYVVDSPIDIVGYIDSNWVGDSSDQKSTYGYVFMIGSCPICFLSKKHSSIAQSSTEVEYRGVVNATMQSIWLQGIMSEFGILSSALVFIFYDNRSAIKISIGPIHRKRTKHIEIHMHYIIGLVHAHIISLQ